MDERTIYNEVMARYMPNHFKIIRTEVVPALIRFGYTPSLSEIFNMIESQSNTIDLLKRVLATTVELSSDEQEDR